MRKNNNTKPKDVHSDINMQHGILSLYRRYRTNINKPNVEAFDKSSRSSGAIAINGWMLPLLPKAMMDTRGIMMKCMEKSTTFYIENLFFLSCVGIRKDPLNLWNNNNDTGGVSVWPKNNSYVMPLPCPSP